MPKNSAVFYIACLLQLACSADVTPSESISDENKAAQCLMQKKHQVAQGSAPDEKPHLEHKPDLSRLSSGAVESVKASSKKVEASDLTQQHAKKENEASHKVKRRSVSKKHAAAGNGTLKRPSQQAHHHKHQHHQVHHDEHSHHKKTRQSAKAAIEDAYKAIYSNRHHKHHHKKAQRSHHKSHRKSSSLIHQEQGKAASLAQVGTSGGHASNKSHNDNWRELLPESLMALGLELFKTEGGIAGAVDNSVPVDVTYAGVKMSLRMNKFDDAVKRVGEEGTWFSYDLDTLTKTDDGSQDIHNMIDIGGNYGVVTIAAMKKHPDSLRVITVEPIPETFFFLKWNLHLNGIPELDAAGLEDKDKRPGVLALHSGSADVAGQDLHFCAYPWASMNSKMCDCTADQDNCHIVPSTSVSDLAGMFGSEPIALVKMDCEGCEETSLPALAEPHISERVHRLAGELHLPERSLEEIACRWDKGRFMSKCQRSPKNHDDIECDKPLVCPE